MLYEKYLPIILFIAIGGIIVFVLKKFNFKVAEISIVKLGLIQFSSVLCGFYGGGLIGGSYNLFGYIILIICVPIAIFTTSIVAYRTFRGQF